MEPTPLTISRWNKRLKILMPQYKKAILSKDFDFAKSLILDIQPLLKNLNKTSKLIEIKNQLFELAIIKNEPNYAIDGLLINRRLINKNTRLHLEATALLAIAYLRICEVEKSKPYIKEVLQNKNVIKTESTRSKFNEEIIKRFDEECTLASLKNEKKVSINLEEAYLKALKYSQTKTEIQLYLELGNSTPKSTKDLLFQIDDFSKNQLTYNERKLLPSSKEFSKNDKVGKTVFSSFKRVLYNSICDPNSEVYKAWYTNGLGAVLDKKFIIVAVSSGLIGFGIGHTALIISACALILRFGLDIYCDMFKPAGLTELRRKS